MRYSLTYQLYNTSLWYESHNAHTYHQWCSTCNFLLVNLFINILYSVRGRDENLSVARCQFLNAPYENSIKFSQQNNDLFRSDVVIISFVCCCYIYHHPAYRELRRKYFVCGSFLNCYSNWKDDCNSGNATKTGWPAKNYQCKAVGDES